MARGTDRIPHAARQAELLGERPRQPGPRVVPAFHWPSVTPRDGGEDEEITHVPAQPPSLQSTYERFPVQRGALNEKRPPCHSGHAFSP